MVILKLVNRSVYIVSLYLKGKKKVVKKKNKKQEKLVGDAL